MPVTKIRSSWSSGNLVFHESTAVAPSTTYDVFTIGTEAVKVGNTANDIDFQWYGTGSKSFILNLGDATAISSGLAWTITGTVGVTGALTVTSAGASALAVGRLGATTPALVVDASTATSITGISIKSAAASGGVAVAAVGETNVALTINAAGSGTIGIGSVSTGAVTITPATTFGSTIASTSTIATTSAATAAISVTATQTSATPGTVRGIYSKETTYTSMTSGNLVGVRGEIVTGGNISGSYLYGVQGKITMGAHSLTTSGSMYCAVLGQMDISAGTLTSGSTACIIASVQDTTNTTRALNGIYVEFPAYGSGSMMSSVLRGFGGATTCLDFYNIIGGSFVTLSTTANSCASAYAAVGSAAYSIKCTIQGVTTYIHTYDAA